MFSRRWKKRELSRTAGARSEPTAPSNAEGGRSPTALTYHRLGVVAQRLEHWDAAERWFAEALRIDAGLSEPLVCAQSCHHLSEVRQAQGRLDEAVAWSVLAFAILNTVPQRRPRGESSKLASLADRVSMADLQEAWLSATGAVLPIEVRQSVERVVGRPWQAEAEQRAGANA